jgi:hypothetical protein
MPAETVQLISEGVDMVLDLDPDVIGTDPRNRGAVERLLARVRAKPGIIPFVGAGLSIPYKLSAWRSFLTEIAEGHKNDHPELPNLVRSHLQNRRFEEAAQQIICAVAQEIFNRILEQNLETMLLKLRTTSR